MQAITSDANRTDWERWALPIGNGHMGAMMFGDTDTERIQLNEETLWSGGPGGTTQSLLDTKDAKGDVYGNVDVYGTGAMQAYIEKIFTDYYNHTYTDSPAQSGSMKVLPNNRLALGTYTNFAELYLDYQHNENVTDYRRELDLRTGLSTVTHTYGGVQYTRQTFASYPDNVIVYRVTANQNGAVNMTVRPEIPFNGTNGQVDSSDRGNDGRIGTVVADLASNTIHLDGVMDNGLNFSGDFYVLPEGGTMTVSNPETTIPNSGGSFTITGANSVLIIVALATNYANSFLNYRQDDPDYSRKNVEARVAAVQDKDFETLYQTHFADYDTLFSRVELDLGGTYSETETTDQLLSTWKSASASGKQNHYLEELYFQYGRYLLIASSKETSLPANLQGIWADQKRPSWQSDYHTNINLQMNYWPAYTTNLAETGVALVNYVDSLQAPGALTAEKLFGVEDTWMVNCSANAMGFTGNINFSASLATTASAFILQNVYDHYQFTQDRELLASTIYPMMKRACKLFMELLQPGRTELDADRLFMVPSYSPEQGSKSWTVGTAYDQQLIYLLFADTVDAANELGVDKAFAAELKSMMERIHPVEIGLDGQVKEYQQEGKYLTDIYTGERISGTDKSHRHNSQLMALHPGNLITTETPEWMQAAETALNLRGDGATGWSMGQKFNMWARLHDGNHAYDKLFVNRMKNGTATNLFDLHPPFQIDGNFGGTAGLAELLVQSHAGYVDILPALPDALSSGSVSGLVAEGNFEIDLRWNNKQLADLHITAHNGGELKVKAGAVTKVVDETSGAKITDIVYHEDGSIGFATEAGHTYAFTTVTEADMSRLQAAVDACQDFSVYAYTDAGKAQSLLTAAQRVLGQGNCYVPTLDALASRLEQAFDSLTARDDSVYGAVLALRLKDSVEEKGISTKNQNAYRVYGGPVIAATMALLDGGDDSACQLQGIDLVQALQTYGKDVQPRTSLYTLLVNLNRAAAENEVLGAAQKQAELVLLDASATAEQIAAAETQLRSAAQGVTYLWKLTTTAGTGGSIMPALDTEVATGSSVSVTLTPDEGYEILELLVNGQSVGAVSTYTLSNIHEDTVIAAHFRRADDSVEDSALLTAALELADSLTESNYTADSWADMQQALNAAQAEDASDAEAEALLAAINALTWASQLTGKVEAESQGLNVAWNDSWDSSKSGAPANNDVQALINRFLESGKTIIVGYGESGKTPSASGKDPWIQFTFTGDRVQFITEKAQTGCVADVYIDGTLITRLDLSTTNELGLPKELVFDSKDYENLTQGEHILLIWSRDVGKESQALAPYRLLRADAFQVDGCLLMTDKSALAKAIAAAERTDTRGCTDESATALQQALRDAKTVLLNENASQDTVDDAYDRLMEALNGLQAAVQPITRIVSPVDVTVPLGTPFDSITLTLTVVFHTESGAYRAEVTWNSEDYDPNVEGQQTISGQVHFDETLFSNPDNLQAEIVLCTVSQPQGIQLNRTELALKTGGSFVLKATYVPDHAETPHIYWTSTDTSVAAVDIHGKVSAIGEGTATVIAATADGSHTAYCVVTVKQADAPKPTKPAKPAKPDTKPEPSLPFLDVHEDDWFYDAVKYVYNNGLMKGTDPNYFSPLRDTTCGMIMMILYRQSGSPAVESDGALWCSDARAWAMENGISDGSNVDGRITRQQLAAMLYRYANWLGCDTSVRGDLDQFTDAAQVSSWAIEAMQWAIGEGILRGRLNGTLDPKGLATRAEVSMMLMRFCENIK